MAKYKIRSIWKVILEDIVELDFDPWDDDSYSKMDEVYGNLAPDMMGANVVDVMYLDDDITEVTE